MDEILSSWIPQRERMRRILPGMRPAAVKLFCIADLLRDPLGRKRQTWHTVKTWMCRPGLQWLFARSVIWVDAHPPKSQPDRAIRLNASCWFPSKADAGCVVHVGVSGCLSFVALAGDMGIFLVVIFKVQSGCSVLHSMHSMHMFWAKPCAL